MTRVLQGKSATERNSVAAGIIAPEYEMRLLLLGNVKIKYIVAVLLLLDVLGIGSMVNTGGHLAHLGGAFFGWFFIYQLREGNDRYCWRFSDTRFFSWV